MIAPTAIALALAVARSYALENCVPPSFYTSLPRDQDWFYGAAKDADADKARLQAIRNLGKQVTGDVENWDVGDVEKLAGLGRDRWQVARSIGRLLPESTLLSGWEQDDFDRCNGYSYVLVRVEKKRVNRFIKENAKFRDDLVRALADRIDKVEGEVADQEHRLSRLEQVVAKLSGDAKLKQQVVEVKNAISAKQPADQIEKKLTAAERNYQHYLEGLKAQAAAGDPKAQSELGEAYMVIALEHRGTPQGASDLATAADWFEKAGDRGTLDALHNLAVLYDNGLGVSKNLEKAAYWWERAARRGDSEAEVRLGVMYSKGEGVPKDDSTAQKWFLKSANRGNVQAQLIMGSGYSEGVGVPINFDKSRMWFLKAAEKGNSEAQFTLGNYYLNGKGVDRNFQTAIGWFQKAATKGYAKAQGQMGDFFYEGRGVQKDLKAAASWYQKSANQGDAFSQKMLGDMYAAGEGVPQDIGAARCWYQKAAAQGDPEAKKGLAALEANK